MYWKLDLYSTGSNKCVSLKVFIKVFCCIIQLLIPSDCFMTAFVEGSFRRTKKRNLYM